LRAAARALARDIDHTFAALLGLSHFARWDQDISDDDADELDRHALRGSVLCRRLAALCEHTTGPLTPTDVVRTAEAAAGTVGAIAPRSVSIECHLDPDTPPTLADEPLLTEMVHLMLEHAAAVLERGGGVATLRSRVEDDRVVLAVRHDGPELEAIAEDDIRLRAIAALAFGQSGELRLAHGDEPGIEIALQRAPT
jgi:nitrogen-specific signal transduction histidine kinase